MSCICSLGAGDIRDADGVKQGSQWGVRLFMSVYQLAPEGMYDSLECILNFHQIPI